MRDGSENWGDLDFPKSPFGESRGDISYFLGVPQGKWKRMPISITKSSITMNHGHVRHLNWRYLLYIRPM